ncbi:hypothetical protein CQW23_28473 [Capsicum baccatum]|uniref:BTB/POZ domain-containing protein n=1 Tax=Capsicum baccatum TaxID=33114 RepID=A0A2G2VGM8_CAPBA|nr:hypothetical protein CQW23_28473 [Capsicum baccatum]
MLFEELRFHRLNLDSFKTPYIQHCILEMTISDVLSDLTIEVGSASFALHRFPLVSRSGRIRKLLLEAKDTQVSRSNLTGLPGGSNAFELAAKFCYRVNVEITISNVALLRCAARFMEMTEEISKKTLEIQYNFPSKPVQCVDSETPSDWWGKSLVVLNLNFFQKVLSGVKTKGLKQDIISGMLINYAQNSLQGLFIKDLQFVKENFLDLDL